MKTFPTTTVASLGGTAIASRYDMYATELDFTPSRWKRREYIPDHTAVEHAELEIHGASRHLRVEFPRGEITVEVTRDQAVDVSTYIAIGRHTYAVYALDGLPFRAILRVTVQRPTVDVSEGTYRVPYPMMRYIQALQLEDDRNAQRVGRFETWVKTLPDDPSDTDTAECIDLDGKWRMRYRPHNSIEDLSVPHLDDTDWESVEVPFSLEESIDVEDGYYWFRRRISIPPDTVQEGERLRIRFFGVDDEAVVYIDGHEVGYNCGWHRPFQFDITDLIAATVSDTHTVAVKLRVRRPRGIFYDGGITYSFVRAYAQNVYPEKNRSLGGIFAHAEISRDRHGGAIRFFPRFYPQSENDMEIVFKYLDTTPERSSNAASFVAMNGSSVFEYAPPKMAYHNVGRNDRPVSIAVIAGYNRDEVLFRVSALEDTELSIRITGPSDDIVTERAQLFVGASTSSYLSVAADGRVETGEAIRSRYDEETTAWEKHVFRRCNPLRVSPEESAYLRTIKQTLTLVAKTVDGEIAGLFTDLIKYPIFWLRDTAISIPGTLYAGDLAHQGAIEAAGEIYSRSKDNADYTILNPDGSMKPQQHADDAPPLAIYSIYKAWCYKDDEWLKQYYPTVITYMSRLDEVERKHGNPPDGMIRSSDGDWWDYKYDSRYEREGAVFFVEVLYLRALKYAAVMADALGDSERATEWRRRLVTGTEIVNRPVVEGGLYMPETGHFADAVTKHTDVHPNGYTFPDEIDEVTVMTAFRPIPHAIALTEGFIQDPTRRRKIVAFYDDYPILRPFPAMVQYPWYDFMGNEGIGGEYETTRFRDAWKALPGNQATGGRWAFAAGLVLRSLWDLDEDRSGTEAFRALAASTTLARHPARTLEDSHSSGLFRNEAGSAIDTEGFYYNWGSAVPLEAVVEGRYGIVPIPGGVRVTPRRSSVGMGIDDVDVPGGRVSLIWSTENTVEITIDTDSGLFLVVDAPTASLASGQDGDKPTVAVAVRSGKTETVSPDTLRLADGPRPVYALRISAPGAVVEISR